MATDFMIFAGNATPVLAEEVSNFLGLRLGRTKVKTFSDSEISVRLGENVRGKDIFIVQSTCYPTNDNLMELLLIADAVYRASANSTTAVIPYFGYGRQDRRVRSARVPISAKVVANMISAVEIDRVLTIDLHSEQIQGFFQIPVDNVYSSPVLVEDVRKQNYENLTVVSPDTGGVIRARAFAKQLDTELAIIDKRRPQANEAEVMHLIGEVKGHTALIIDDMVDTAGTLCKAATALKEKGAAKVVAYCTHPVLSGSAVANIESSALDSLVVTDTIPLREDALNCGKIRQLSMGRFLGESIRRISSGESVRAMFEVA